MIPLAIIAASVGLPILLAVLFRVSAPLLFLSIMTGSVLQRGLGDTASITIGAAVNAPHVDLITNIGLLVLPVLLTLIFARKSIKPIHIPVQILPFLLCGLAFAAFCWPLLPESVTSSANLPPITQNINKSSDLIVAGAAAINLIIAWFTFRPKHQTTKGKH